ncbi:DUF134 domain-containing protein [Candidatus Dojkabacteria bacterium]|nr:DUF134 domain-containing protein [Candidatus Dojkabacteria bacterium]
MPRRFRRRVNYNFKDSYYKPRGVKLKDLEEVKISSEELEVLRLRYLEKLDQREAAAKMGISQSQYQRDMAEALKKITEALVEVKAIDLIVSQK